MAKTPVAGLLEETIVQMMGIGPTGNKTARQI
jgi:hypothetical protein